MDEKEKSIFDIITDHSVNEGLTRTLLEDEEYIRIQEEIDGKTEQIDSQDFTKEQRLMIDRLVCAYTENGALYGRMTYQQGFRDCVSFLLEIGLIGVA